MIRRASTQQCYAFFFLLLLVGTISIQSLYMIFFAGNFPLALPLAVFLCVGLMAYIMEDTAQLLLFLRNILGLCALFFVISLPIPDFSYDGVWYHQPIANALAAGQNVFNTSVQSYWGDAYPKAVEIFAGEMLRLFPSSNAYMVINALLAAGLWAYIKYFSAQFGVAVRQQNIFAFFTVFSFVFVQLAYMHLVDYVLYAMMLYILLSLTLMVRNKAQALDYIMFIMAGSLAFSCKMSGGLFPFVAFCMLFAYVLFAQKSLMAAVKKCLHLGLPVALLGVGILGYNPYITNVMAGKHILSPLAGEGTDHIAIKEHPTNFTGKNRFEKLFLSLAGETANMRNGEGDSTLKLNPLRITQAEVIATMGASARVAGWGPLFLAIVLLSLALPYFYTLRKAVLAPFLIFIALCTALHPESWWARYGFYIYLLPLSMIFCIQSVREGRSARVATGLLRAMVLLLAVNLGIFVYGKFESVKGSYTEYSRIFSAYTSGSADICREEFDYKFSFHPQQLFAFYGADLDKVNGPRCFDGTAQEKNWYFTYTPLP